LWAFLNRLFLRITGLKENDLVHIQIPRKSNSKETFDDAVEYLLCRFENRRNGARAPALVSRFAVEKGFVDKNILDGEVNPNTLDLRRQHPARDGHDWCPPREKIG
jgi:hypothetical protein